jgi:excisionase family DNA binding protein
MKQEFFTVKECSALSGLPEKTIYTWIRRKQVKFVKLKWRVMIDRTTLDQMIAEKQNIAVTA